MSRKRIIVMGFMGGCPIAGVVWQHIHYIVGLQRLGHEVTLAAADAASDGVRKALARNAGLKVGPVEATVAAADVVISTALIPGRAAPTLVTEEMVKAGTLEDFGDVRRIWYYMADAALDKINA